MTTVVNFPRRTMRDWSTYVDPDKAIWIAIGEPGHAHMSYDAVRNPFLDDLPNLHINFWDLTVPVPAIGGDDKEIFLYPPNEKDAKTIVDFILAHKNKHVFVNCRAGKSRSAAVAQFCMELLGYEWTGDGRRIAVPNTTLFKLMKEYYLSFNPEPVKVIDKRRKF